MKNGRSNGTRPGRERAIVAALRLPSQSRLGVEESLEELASLAEAAGATVVDRVVQERPAPTPSLYFGTGKVEGLRDLARTHDANLLISDDALSPVQERNLTEATRLKVIDRTALILDIFAQRARTSEGKLQVELAQLTYLLPRLVGQWSHLERLGGGIGTRGPGETQLESDRRVIRRRLVQLRAQLGRVQVHRKLQRDRRRRSGTPVVALVGYTNAGKTTLLNRLTGAELRVADQPFVTLDPAARLVRPEVHRERSFRRLASSAGDPSPGPLSGSRGVEPPDCLPFILTDTVGFIRKLPHQLVAAFRATLEELSEADVLLHVVDASHPSRDEHIAAVEALLGELGLSDRSTIMVLNKVDRAEGGRALEALADAADGVTISAATGTGIAGLLARIEVTLRRLSGSLRLRIPYAAGGTLAFCYDRGRVLAREDEPAGIRLDVELPAHLVPAVSAYRV